LHSILAHQLELLQLADAPLLVRREKPAAVELAQLHLVSDVLFLEGAELGVICGETCDQRFQIGHWDLLCGEVAAVVTSYTPLASRGQRLASPRSRRPAVALKCATPAAPARRPNSSTERCVTRATRGNPQSTITRT